ncbi:MAG: cytochrome c biogenesis protein CcdA, partial [Actinomycetota bacterium]
HVGSVVDFSIASYATAFAAGFVSFASPCVLALVPGYLSYISGVSYDDLAVKTREVTAATAAFVAGFACVFTLFGVSAALLGHSLTRDKDTLNVVGGVMLITMAVLMLALPRLGWLQSDRHLKLARKPTTLVGAGLAGAVFAAGWTPCIGPFLGSILSVAAPTQDPLLGGTLLFVYSMGLGIPFLMAGLFFTRTLGAFRRVRRHWTVVNTAGAVIVAAIGVLVLTGRLELITRQLSGVGFTGI